MTTIILEGPDNSGKSTLANLILQEVPLILQQSEGPEKFPGEMIERITRYAKMENVLYDRHPAISQPIYNMFREDATPVPQDLIDQLMATKPLIIFCDNVAGFDDREHQVKAHDTPEHLAMVHEFDQKIRHQYRVWARVHAHHMYKIGDDFTPIIQACKEHAHAA